MRVVLDCNVEEYHREVGMSSAHGIRMNNPVRPGGFVRHEIVEAIELSVTEATRALGVARAGEIEGRPVCE